MGRSRRPALTLGTPREREAIGTAPGGSRVQILVCKKLSAACIEDPAQPRPECPRH